MIVAAIGNIGKAIFTDGHKPHVICVETRVVAPHDGVALDRNGEILRRLHASRNHRVGEYCSSQLLPMLGNYLLGGDIDCELLLPILTDIQIAAFQGESNEEGCGSNSDVASKHEVWFRRANPRPRYLQSIGKVPWTPTLIHPNGQ